MTTAEAGGTELPKVVGIPVAFGIEQFKDRLGERERLGRLLSAPNTRLVSIIGRRGIGKSALAARVLRGLESNKWPHTGEGSPVSGLVYAGARRRGISVEQIYFDLASVLGEDTASRLAGSWASTASMEERISALFAATTGGLYIVLLDNFEDELTDSGDLVDEDLILFFDLLFRSAAHPRVLVTSQVPINFDPRLRRFDLTIELKEGLPVQDAVEFLRESDPNDELNLRSAPDAELQTVAERLYGLPRALELYVGGLYDDVLLPAPADLLEKFPTRVDVVTELAQDRYRALDNEHRLVIKVMALFASPVPADAIRFTLEPFASFIDVHPILARLAKVRLIGVDRSARLWDLHPMDADLAYAELKESNYSLYLGLHRRAADWYQLQHRERSTWKTPDDLFAHRRDFHHRICAGDHDDACRVLAEIWQFLIWSGSVSAVRSMCHALEGNIDDDMLELDYAVALAFVNLIGGPEQANLELLEPKIPRYDELGASELSAKAYFVLGDYYRRARRPREGIALLAKAAGLFEAFGNQEWQFHTMLVLGLAHLAAGDTSAARRVSEQIETILNTNNAGPDGHARKLDLLQAVELAEGHWERAYQTGQEGLRRYEESGIREATGYIHNGIGLSMVGAGRLREAIPWLEQGIHEGVLVENPRVQGLCLYNLSCAHMMLGDLDSAAQAAQEAVDSFRRHASIEERVAVALLEAVTALQSTDQRGGITRLRELLRLSVGSVDLCMPSIIGAFTEGISSSADPATDL